MYEDPSWDNYSVQFKIGHATYRGNTLHGIRTPAAKCVVTIASGEVTVETV